MRLRWGIFWLLLLGSLLAFGAWRQSLAEYNRQTRGHVSAAQTAALPDRLPLPGVNVALTSYDDPAAELDQISALGFVWLRQPFLWEDIEPEPGVYNWTPYDAIVDAVAEREGLRLIALINGTPAWARHRNAPEHPLAPPESPAAYGEFAGRLAARYGEVIDHYEIWDEPNIEQAWGNLNPRPALYLAMLDAAYQAIHTADSDAMVIAAALAPTVEDGPDNINEVSYLRALYDLGGADSFDAVAGKPYGFDHPPDDRTVDINRLNVSRLILLREEMVRQGDGDKPLWGSNFGWNALPEDWQGPPSIWGNTTRAQQIDYTAATYARAAREWPWAGGLILQHWAPDAPPDDPIQGFAVRPYADLWLGAIPTPDAMPPGRFPATTPYAVYAGDWTFSDLGADAGPEAAVNTITVPFSGTDFALILRRGDYLAYLSVTINGQPANELPRNRQGDAFIPLTSAEREPAVDIVHVASGLDDQTLHQAVITHRPELGDDRFPMVGFAVGHQPKASRWPAQLALGAFILSLVLMIGVGSRLPWRNLRWPSAASLRNGADFLLGLFFSSVVMVGAVLTWQDTLATALRRDLPTALTALATSSLLYYAPSTWLALIGLIITGVIIFNRPWVGVLQVLFWSAFFSSNLDPFFRALALVDVLLVVTLAATFGRLLYDYAQQKPHMQWPRLHPLDWMMLGFVGVAALSLMWSDLLPTALRHLRIMIIGPALFYGLIRALRPNLRDLAFLVEALLFTGFLLSVIGLGAYLTEAHIVITQEGARRLTSVYGSPNSLALYLGRCLPFALAYLLMPVSEWRRIFAAITGGVMLMAFILTQSLGGLLLGLPAAFAIVLLASRGRQMAPILGGLAVAGAAALVPLSVVLPRLRNILDFENSTSGIRLNLWRSTAQMLADQPLTGVGLDQFLYHYRSAYILPENWEDPDLSHPHNLVLDYWVQLGVLGLLLGLGLQWLFWRQALAVYRQVREQSALQTALVIGSMGAMGYFLAHGLIDMAHFNINLSYIVALLLAIVVQVPQSEDAL